MWRAHGRRTHRLCDPTAECIGVTSVAAQMIATANAFPSTANRPAGAPHIVAILPRGEAIRNFVHTNALDRLAEQARVTLLTVLPTPQYRQNFERRYDAVHELEQIDERWAVRIQRDVLDMAHGRWMWSE